MQVKSIAECSHSAILLAFISATVCHEDIVLSIFEWPFYTVFTVLHSFLLFLFRHRAFSFLLDWNWNLYQLICYFVSEIPLCPTAVRKCLALGVSDLHFVSI